MLEASHFRTVAENQEFGLFHSGNKLSAVALAKIQVQLYGLFWIHIDGDGRQQLGGELVAHVLEVVLRVVAVAQGAEQQGQQRGA